MNLNIEDKIILDCYEPRPYQQELFDALDQGYKKILLVWPRRAGKDFSCFQAAIRQCIKKVCLVLYVLPTFGSGRRSIWQAINSDGQTFLSSIPTRLIAKINDTEMRVVFTNGSILQIVGGDTHDTSIRGTNAQMVVLSEYAYMQSDEVYNTVRPILAANNGICLINSTPQGKNFFWHLYNVAKELPDWKVIHKTTDQIKHIAPYILEQEKAQMSPELYAQEYNCEFTRGRTGSIYGNALQALKDAGQITTVAHEPGLLTHVVFDIGIADATALIFFQVVGDGTVIRIIDCLSASNQGLDYYALKIQERGIKYRYGKIFMPHDAKVREWGGGGITRYEKARQLDLDVIVLDQLDLADGIENVLTHFPKFWIDSVRCQPLISALENYYREWDEVKQVYSRLPVRNWATHYADCLRYLCQSLHKTKKGMSAEEFDRIRAQALYGPKLNKIFDPRYDNR